MELDCNPSRGVNGSVAVQSEINSDNLPSLKYNRYKTEEIYTCMSLYFQESFQTFVFVPF